jgi:DNA modification methylase
MEELLMKLLQGDCLDILKTLEDNSVDSLITDPPAGISFMGKEWDEDKGGRKQWIAWMTEVMQECLRVMKPGAHGLVWAIPRTSHWTATALEDAGFEVRDVVTHLFGSGFPKSHNIEKILGEES